MARVFRFRLAPVLRVRRAEMERRQRRVAVRLAAIRDLEQRAARLDAEIRRQVEAARQSLCGGSLAIEQVVWDRHQLARLRRELAEAGASLERHQAELTRERAALSAAHVRVRVLERLEEQRREAHAAEGARLERAVDDERNVQCAARRMSETEPTVVSN